MFLYISYLLPVAAGLVAYRRTWTQMGPFNMGSFYPVVAISSGLVGLARSSCSNRWCCAGGR